MNIHSVSEFLAELPANKREQVSALRIIILKAEPRLKENIKWNAPNYVFNNQDRLTFNVMNKEQKVRIILHMGAKIKENKQKPPIIQEDFGIVKWQSNIRGFISFDDLDDVMNKSVLMTKVIANWLAVKLPSE